MLSNLSSVIGPGFVSTDFRNLNFIYSLGEDSKQQLYTACLGSRVLKQDASLNSAIDSIESDFQQRIAKNSREHLFLHAGVIGWRGRAILFPGRTCTGKSTLIQALIRAGAVYFSDEFARIDACGLVHPFPRPLALRAAQGRSTLYPEQEGLRIASGPCQVGAIVATQYVSEGVWCPTRVSPGYAALELLNNTVAVRLDPAKAVRFIGKLASTAAAISSLRGEAESTAPLLLETLDTLLD